MEFVTHDILPDLDSRIIAALQNVGRERLHAKRLRREDISTYDVGVETNNVHEEHGAPITFKHEPPLLHVAASSLEAGKRLLHIAKSKCALRESGLVVTDQRVTVEIRTTGSLLCLPLMVQTKSVGDGSEGEVTLLPNEGYLLSLAVMAYERMVQNEKILEKLYKSVQDELFDNATGATADDGGSGNWNYKMSLQPLPPLNIWKTAAVVIPSKENDDLDIIAFGGQGIGPDLSHLGDAPTNTCKRWDAVFRLGRKDGVWMECWEPLPILHCTNEGTDSAHVTTSQTHFRISAGLIQVKHANNIGSREGHCAALRPRHQRDGLTDVVILFGGRTGGPMSPSNDLFVFMLSKEKNVGMFGRPTDVRGTSPEPRYGHTMTSLHCPSNLGLGTDSRDTLVVVAGGFGLSDTGKAVSLPSLYTLSCITDDDSDTSHLIWDRISDLPSPRAYHTAFVNGTSDHFFVFGGISDPNDPFALLDELTGTNNTGLNLPLFGKDGDLHNKQAKSNNAIDMNELPHLIGSSSATLKFKSDNAVLLVGGAKSLTTTDDSGQDTQSPSNILQYNSAEHRLSKGQISSIEIHENAKDSSHAIDFGACVHHCLLTLPKKKATALTGDDTASAVIVGGGVPSFSFAQSYAR